MRYPTPGSDRGWCRPCRASARPKAGSAGSGSKVGPAWRSARQLEADDATKVAERGTFLGIAGQIQRATRAAMAAQAGLHVIFGHGDAEDRAAVLVDNCGERLAL